MVRRVEQGHCLLIYIYTVIYLEPKCPLFVWKRPSFRGKTKDKRVAGNKIQHNGDPILIPPPPGATRSPGRQNFSNFGTLPTSP